MGKALGIILLLGLLIWGALDLLVWLLGGETFSKYVIKRSKENKIYGWSMLLIVTGGAALLVWHWELIPILF